MIRKIKIILNSNVSIVKNNIIYHLQGVRSSLVFSNIDNLVVLFQILDNSCLTQIQAILSPTDSSPSTVTVLNLFE